MMIMIEIFLFWLFLKKNIHSSFNIKGEKKIIINNNHKQFIIFFLKVI